MRLVWLEVHDFRCYTALRWEPDPGLNLLVGPNGAGKTSLVEAIGYLGSLRSFRGVADSALVRTGAEAAIVRGAFAGDAGEATVEAELPAAGRRRILYNGKRPQRLRDVVARVPVVSFDPDDLVLVKGPPGERRRYLDDLAVRIWPVAGGDQDEYERAVRQRNALLRAEGPAAELDVWDAQVASAGGRVAMRRLALLERLDPVLADVYREVAGEPGVRLTTGYVAKAWDDTPAGDEEAAAAILGRLRERRWLDRERRVTTTGPHRDEPTLQLDGRDARTMISQGEQRTVALALRLASFDLVLDRAGSPPLLVLDDVFSELDGARATAVVRRLPAAQVFATTARPGDTAAGGHRWQVGGGAVTAGGDDGP